MPLFPSRSKDGPLMSMVNPIRSRSEIEGRPRRLISFRHASMLCLAFAAASGCAKNHYYIEPNGQVTSVSHQPFFGLRKHSPEAVQMAAVPTEVQGGKVISVAPANPGMSAQVGVVNPAIPEAVVVQPPANQGVIQEPPLVNGSLDSSGTQVSGGIRTQSATGGSKVVEGLLD